jgi:cytochrome b
VSLHRVRVWDWLTRAIHWLLVALIPFAWWTYKTDRMQWHRTAGYAVLALLTCRLFWGVFGSETARFASFVRGPRSAWRYLTGKMQSTIGHNPLGGWSVVALFALLSAQATLGLFAADDEGLESGPFANTISFDAAQSAEHWHGLLFNVLLALIGLHIAAILFYLLRGNNLVWPMIGGTKFVPGQEAAPKQASVSRALIAVALAAAVFAWLWWVEHS